jgi:hypothetical protein
MNKTPLTRLRELVRVLKGDDNLVHIQADLVNGFQIEGIWQPKDGVIFLMLDRVNPKKIIYLEDKEIEDKELLKIVLALENEL